MEQQTGSTKKFSRQFSTIDELVEFIKTQEAKTGLRFQWDRTTKTACVDCDEAMYWKLQGQGEAGNN